MHNSWIENKRICPPVPLGWEWIPLKDVTQVQGGFAFHSSDFTTFGIPVVRMSDLKQGMLDLSEAVKVSDQTVCQLSQFMLKKGDLIIGMSGSITNYAIVDEQNLPAYLNQRVGRLILKDKNRANYNYLTHVLRSPFYESWAYKEATGVAQLNISSQQIEAMYFLLPPLPEQRRIAEILDTIDEAIQKTEALISKLKAMKQGLLHDLHTRGLDKNGKLRDPKAHPEQFKDSPLGRIPKEWHTTKLAKLVIRAEYGISVSLEDDSGIPVLRMNNLIAGEVDLSELKYSKSREASNLLLNPRDVLFNRTNSMEHVGKTAIWRGQLEGTSFASYLVRIVPDYSKLIPEYLNLWLNSQSTQILIRKYATPSVHQVNINPTNLQKADITLPQSVEEQYTIVDAVDVHDASIRTEEHYRDKLKLQKKGLMHDLLTGKFRVQGIT